MRYFRRCTVVLALAASLLAGRGATADDAPKTPYLKIDIPVELQHDWHFSSEDPATRGSDLFTTIEPTVTLGLWRGLSVVAALVLEPLHPRAPRRHRALGDHGLYVEQLFVRYEGSVALDRKDAARTLGFAVFAGKFNPAFGVAWDKAPGIYGIDFAEDYELTERIGFGGSVTAEGGFGVHTLTVSTFFADTSILSESVITRRGRTRLGAGGPGNTEDFSSFTVALDGSKIEWPGGAVGYHIGFARQAVQNGASERALALALFNEFTYRGYAIKPLVEYVRFWNREGAAGAGTDYLTASIAIARGSWTVAVAHTIRQFTGAGAARDALVQTSLHYAFKHGIGVAFGYSFRNDAGAGTHTLGVLLSWEYSRAFALARR